MSENYYDLERKIRALENKKTLSINCVSFFSEDNLSDEENKYEIKFKVTKSGSVFIKLEFNDASPSAVVCLNGVKIEKITDGEKICEMTLPLIAGESTLTVTTTNCKVKSLNVYGQVENLTDNDRLTLLEADDKVLLSHFDGRKNILSVYDVDGEDFNLLYKKSAVSDGTISKSGNGFSGFTVYYIENEVLKSAEYDFSSGIGDTITVIGNGVTSVSGTLKEGFKAIYYVKDKKLYFLYSNANGTVIEDLDCKNVYKVISSPKVKNTFIVINYDKTAILFAEKQR